MSDLDFVFKKTELNEIESETIKENKSSIIEDNILFQMSRTGITLSQLSHNINIPTWKLRMIMNGEVKATDEQRNKIANQLNCDVNSLFNVGPSIIPLVKERKKGRGRHMINKFIVDSELKGL